MFNIFEKKGQTIIQLTAGDTCEISTDPFYDANDDNIYNPEDYDETIILAEQDYVVFTIGSTSGRTYLRKVLTIDNYNDKGELILLLSPTDTKDMQPYKYLFSFTYYPNAGEQSYTYNQGIFELMPTICTVDDLHNYLNPPIDDDIDTDTGEDNTDNEGNTDNNEDNNGDNTDTPTPPDNPSDTETTDPTEPIDPNAPSEDNGGDDTPTEP